MHVFELQRFDGDLYVGTGSFEEGYGVYRTREPARRSASTPWSPAAPAWAGNGLGRRDAPVPRPALRRRRQLVQRRAARAAGLRAHPHRPCRALGGRDRRSAARSPTGGSATRSAACPPATRTSSTRTCGGWCSAAAPSTSGRSTGAGCSRSPTAGPASGRGSSTKRSPVRSASTSGPAATASTGCRSRAPRSTRTPYDFGVRSLVNTRRAMYVGTANHAFGTRIWDERRTLCAAPGETSGARAARGPRQLLTDVQRDGTVLSWEGSPGTARYRVERAAYVETPATFRFPPGPPGGGADPAPRSPARSRPARRAASACASRCASRSPTVGRTTGPLVRRHDATAGDAPPTRWWRRAGSRASPPSNLQVVPDPRPPATWAQLARLAPRARAAAAIARSDRTAGRRALARLARNTGDDRVRRPARPGRASVPPPGRRRRAAGGGRRRARARRPPSGRAATRRAPRRPRGRPAAGRPLRLRLATHPGFEPLDDAARSAFAPLAGGHPSRGRRDRGGGAA